MGYYLDTTAVLSFQMRACHRTGLRDRLGPGDWLTCSETSSNSADKALLSSGHVTACQRQASRHVTGAGALRTRSAGTQTAASGPEGGGRDLAVPAGEVPVMTRDADRCTGPAALERPTHGMTSHDPEQPHDLTGRA